MPVGGPDAPAIQHVRARTVRVWCVVPWFSRAEEVEALLGDLSRLEVEGELANGEAVGLSVQVVAVDNASAERVTLPASAGEKAIGVRFEQMRLEENVGGSGGFNAGISKAIEECEHNASGYVWLVDSDARVAPTTLMELVRVLEGRADLCVAGSAIADPATGRVFEVGGMIDRRTGALRAACAGSAGAGGAGGVLECDYVASCSALVRLGSARECGPMPDLFLHADDAAWMVRMRRVTGKKVAAVRDSVVYHPRFDRFALRGRYFAARNGFEPLRELGLGRRVALRRAAREVGRAVQQELMGRRDLARLHVLGLRDAADGVRGVGNAMEVVVDGFKPLAELGDVLKPHLGHVGSWRAAVASERELGLSDAEFAQLCAELGRAGVHVAQGGKGAEWRVVNAAAKGTGLLRGAGLIEVAPGVRGGGGGGSKPGFVVRSGMALGALWNAGCTGLAATWQAWRVRKRWHVETPAALARDDGTTGRGELRAETLSVVVVSYNRWSELRGTLRRVQEMLGAGGGGAEVIVVDNASSDDSAEGVEREFPGVTLIRMGENRGVAAFNRGVEAATGDVVLVLDDDSWPDTGAVEAALRVLNQEPEVGGVALHPRHPVNGKSEWRFAAQVEEGGRGDWPVMGCGNVVRRAAWMEVGGYEEGFFLYRNDVDLALKLLEAGWGVYFDPALTVWHESPAAAKKSERWHRLATRNWIWLAKRHGRGLGLGGLCGALAGWAWAHRLAGWSVGRQWATVRGGVGGALRRPPGAPGVRGTRGTRRVGRFGGLVGMLVGRGAR